MFFCHSSFAQFANRCISDEYFSYQLQNPEIIKLRQVIEKIDRKWIKNNRNALRGRTEFVIPIVVHVVWQTPRENICEEQISSQIAVLNDDFNQANRNLDIVPEDFSRLIANTGIRFCLAKVDPDGRPTTGVTRTRTNVSLIGRKRDIHYTAQGGRDAWDTSKYLNIWLGNTGSGLLGIGKTPGLAPPTEDGVVINSRYFGTTGTAFSASPYNLGRVATHEIGHYLNLSHPWGSGSPKCEEDDLVEDTPPQGVFYSGCPDLPQASCGSTDIVVNFMDFVDDRCMAMFTEGQKLRMLATLHNFRKELVENSAAVCEYNTPSSVDFEIIVFPNPSVGFLNLRLERKDISPTSVTIYDAMGRIVLRRNLGLESQLSICTQNYPSGIYFVSVKTAEQELTKKVIVAN